MSIIEFIAGILILAASIHVSGACYFVKNDKGGVNAALGPVIICPLGATTITSN